MSSNELGKIQAAPAEDGGGDPGLPDPTKTATKILLLCLGASFIVAAIYDLADVGAEPFKPAQEGSANFALFAGFYVAAQIIERLMELIAPSLPWWKMPSEITDPKVMAAQRKADRAKATLGIATILGAAISGAFGLYFLAAVGIDIPLVWDVFFTGMIIAAGTKPLHDFTTSLQNKNSPNTETTSPVG